MGAVDSAEFVRGMRALAASVHMVTTLQDGAPAGLLATAVCSVSADPPMLLVCVNRDAGTHAAICGSGVFCVNLLRAEQQALARRFLGLVGADRFGLCGWRALATGAPAIDGALVSFDCTVVRSIPAGTHSIFVGLVVASALSADTAAAPLLYFDGAYTRLERPRMPAGPA